MSMKFIILASILLACVMLTENKNSKQGPKYEKVPLIERHDSPLDITFHNRVELMKADPKTQFNYIMAQKKKISLRSELVREFTVKALSNWLDHLAAQDLNMIHKGEFMEDLSNLKGFAKILQSHIIGKANSVMDKLTLMDLKLKEQKLIEQEIQGIKQHPGNISSNLGNNLPWKERLEEIVNNSASIHTEFDVALKGICNVIRRVNMFVENMNRTYMDSRQIHQPGPENQYYPTDQQVLDNQPIVHPLGPKVGHITHFKKNMDALKSSKTTEAVDKNDKTSTKDLIIKEIKKSLLPEIKKEISEQVKAEVHKTIGGKHNKSVIENIAHEEAKLSQISKNKALPAVQKEIKRTVKDVANKVADDAALIIATNKSIKRAEKIIEKAVAKVGDGKKVNSKTKKKIEDARNQVKETVSKKLDKAVAKSLSESPKVEVSTSEGKEAVRPIVHNCAATALQNLKSDVINKKVQKAIEKAAVKKASLNSHNSGPGDEKATTKVKNILKQVNKALVKAEAKSIKAEQKLEQAKIAESQNPQKSASHAVIETQKKAEIANKKVAILTKTAQEIKKVAKEVEKGEDPKVALEKAKSQVNEAKSKIEKVKSKITEHRY